jgi:hypothetical protein
MKYLVTLAAIVAVNAVYAATAGASGALSPGNLIQNPGAEAAPGAKNYGTVAIPGWQTSAKFTALVYIPRSLDMPSTEQSSGWGGGANYFSAGDAVSSSATQTIDISADAAKIDAGIVAAKLSALIGGSRAQEDRGAVEVVFLDAAGSELGKLAVGTPTRDERKMVTKLLPKSAVASVPAKTRSLRVTMSATRVTGSYVDVYFDNLSLTLAEQKLAASLAVGSCNAKTVTASVKAAGGVALTSVAFSAKGKKVVDSAAPFSAKLAAAGKGRVAVTAVVTDAAGRVATLKKSVKGCA